MQGLQHVNRHDLRNWHVYVNLNDCDKTPCEIHMANKPPDLLNIEIIKMATYLIHSNTMIGFIAANSTVITFERKSNKSALWVILLKSWLLQAAGEKETKKQKIKRLSVRMLHFDMIRVDNMQTKEKKENEIKKF